MSKLEGVIYFESTVIFIWILYVLEIARRIRLGYIIVKHRKERKNQVACEPGNTKPKEEQKHEALAKQVKLLQQELKLERSRVESLREELSKKKQEKDDALKREKQKNEALAKQLNLLQQELKLERSNVERLREELSKEKQEKDDALKRLSAIMSSRLRDGNPNVVDLSDQNRPIKVGEQFSELYDNQWTDAYGALETYFGHCKEEPELISILLNILQQCFVACKEKANQQLIQLNENVTNITAIITKKSCKLPNDLMQRIKEERKLFVTDELPACDMVLPILKEYFSSLVLDTGFLENNALHVFVKECLKLSWLMLIQDPPMTMVLKPGDKASDSFKAYKHRGEHLVFVVWPALLLKEGGPLIMKGVAEFNDVFEVSETS